jgi:deoxyribodipyrimidine photolyase-related protein
MFLNSRDENTQLFDQDRKPRMQEFYKYQRRKLDILIDSDNKPTGGQWSHDDANRKKIPTSARGDIPSDPTPYSDKQVDAAKQWVETHFADNPGNLDTYWLEPTRTGALNALEEFISNRYKLFGDYEDAIDSDYWRLYHSALSPYLNCGLLTPQEVLKAATKAYSKGSVPINAHEGFVRQIIGWREYMRSIYDIHGVSLRNANEWQHTNTLSNKWYTAHTNLRPLDSALESAINHAYNHHIERLMIIGNAMFLCRIHPHEVYRWFMEMYLDAYDWVMVGNVYGMSQDTIDGLITTKPYFSGSNYICKMSNYTPSEEWCPTWDALYWSFIIEHREALAGNYRWGMMLSHLDKMSEEQQADYIQQKNDYLESLS